MILAGLLLGDAWGSGRDADHPQRAHAVGSLPVIGSFIATFGVAAALLSSSALRLDVAPAVAGGLIAAVVLGACTSALARALVNLPSDPAPRAEELVGALATVVTPIPDGGEGAVAISKPGQSVKVSARSEAPLQYGTTVIVIDVTSPTEVMVAESGF